MDARQIAESTVRLVKAKKPAVCDGEEDHEDDGDVLELDDPRVHEFTLRDDTLPAVLEKQRLDTL